jgi:hypothetical protein
MFTRGDGAKVIVMPRRGMGAIVTDYRQAQPGDVLVQPGFAPMLYTGSGYTSMPGYSINSRGPQPEVAHPSGGFQSLAPGMATAGWSQTLDDYLAKILEAAEGQYASQHPGTAAAATFAADLVENAKSFCQTAPMSPGCDNPTAVGVNYGNRYVNYAGRVDAYVANPSSQTGEPVYPTGYFSAPVVSGGPGGGLQYGGGVQQAGGPGGFVPLAGAGGGGTGGGGGTAPVPATAVIVNKTHPGQAFKVGDSWELTIRGGANQPVSGSATQNGKSLGTTPYGSTDANGVKVLTGTMDSSVLGDWREMWTVGTSPAPVLIFSVADVTGGGGGSGGSGGGSGSGGGGGGTPAAGSSITDFLSQKFDLFGFSIPVWAAGAGVAGALWAFGGKK